MVLYDENTDLDLEKFDIYNQYRDQICFIKVNKINFNIAIEPDDWQKLKTIVFKEDHTQSLCDLREWFTKTAPEKFGPDKDFDFTDALFEKLKQALKAKFT